MLSKVKILFLAIDSENALHLRLDKEFHEIDKNISTGSHRDLFELFSVWAVKPGDLQTALLRYKPHIVHFSGHGMRRKGLSFENVEGQRKFISPQALANLFRVIGDTVRLVFLNSCHTKSQATALAKTVDFTISMNSDIGDDAAIILAASFYRALSFGQSVSEAFELAKNQLELEGLKGSKIPR